MNRSAHIAHSMRKNYGSIWFYLSVLLSLVGTLCGFFRFSCYRTELLLSDFATRSVAARLLAGNLFTAFLFGGSYFSCLCAVGSVFALFGFSFLNAYALCCFLYVQKSVSLLHALLSCLLCVLCQLLLCVSCLKNAEIAGMRFVKTLREAAFSDKRALLLHFALTALFFAAVLLRYFLI